MRDVRDGYQAFCTNCGRLVGEPLEILPPARLAVNAVGDLVMRMIVAGGCDGCGTINVEILVRPMRSA